jgi:hypothetical protein
MGQYRVLAGQHAQQEYLTDERGDVLKGDDGRPRITNRVYNTGQVVSSDADLVALFGANKFERVQTEGRRARRGKVGEGEEEAESAGGAGPLRGLPSAVTQPTPAPLNPGVFPGGQVSSGYQAAAQTPTPYTNPSAPVEGGIQPAFAGPDGTKESGQPRSSPAERAAQAEQGGKPKSAQQPKAGAKGPPPAAPAKAYTRAELEEMTVADLKELADEEEVDLAGATKKDEIIDAILKAQ